MNMPSFSGSIVIVITSSLPRETLPLAPGLGLLLFGGLEPSPEEPNPDPRPVSENPPPDVPLKLFHPSPPLLFGVDSSGPSVPLPTAPPWVVKALVVRCVYPLIPLRDILAVDDFTEFCGLDEVGCLLVAGVAHGSESMPPNESCRPLVGRTGVETFA